MDDLEVRLRTSLAHQVTTAPGLLDLPDLVVRRARRTRHRRQLALGAGALTIVTLAGVLVATRGGSPSGLDVANDPTPRATQTSGPAVAPDSWVQGLAHNALPHLATTAFVGSNAIFPEATSPVMGVDGQVYAATPVGDSVLVTYVPPGVGARTVVIAPDGSRRTLADSTTDGHAVDPTGTKVALGVLDGQGNAVIRVVDMRTNQVLASTTLSDALGRGTPFGWVGDEVLMTTGDGGAVFAKAWNTRTGAVRVIGEPGTYWGGYGVAGSTDLVALRQGDGPCIGVSRLPVAGDLWRVCGPAYAGFSPDASRLLLQQDSASGMPVGAQVVDALTGRAVAALALPDRGLLAVGWSDDDTVAAVVRVLDPTGARSMLVVTCPVSGAACTAHDQLDDVATAFVANARG